MKIKNYTYKKTEGGKTIHCDILVKNHEGVYHRIEIIEHFVFR